MEYKEGFRSQLFAWIIAFLWAITGLVGMGGLETIVLIVPAIIWAIITNRWPGWMWFLSKKSYHILNRVVYFPAGFWGSTTVYLRKR